MSKSRKPIPYDFVLEELDSVSPLAKAMFGAFAIYVGDRIVLILNQSEKTPGNNGVWLATTPEHHDSLRGDFPNMRSLTLFGHSPVTSWQLLPEDADDFEESVLKACELVRQGDARIGKVPQSRRGPKKAKKKVLTDKSKSKPTTKPKRKVKSEAEPTRKTKTKTKTKQRPKAKPVTESKSKRKSPSKIGRKPTPKAKKRSN